MTNWKEQFRHEFSAGNWIEDETNNLTDFISTEIIEKLIDEIPNINEYTRLPYDIDGVKQQLKSKWL